MFLCVRVCVFVCVSTEEEEEEEEDEEEVKDRSQPRWTVWLEVESSRDAAHWLPWRPDKAKGQSEEDCEDPDRQVLLLSVSAHVCLDAIYYYKIKPLMVTKCALTSASLSFSP